MRKNGFTFIEILGVITLLALLSVIVLMVVDKSLKDSKSTLSDVQIENIKSAASMWRTDNIEYVPEGGYYTLTLGELIDLGYIDDVIDPSSGNSFNRNLIVKVSMNSVLVDEQSSIDDITDSNIISEVALINSNVDSGILDGIYYYNASGNLERGPSVIYLSRNFNNPKGNILIHNHQFISGCITIGSNNYDYYKGVITKLNYSCSTNRGDNLFVNGDLSFKDNTNFSSFTYNNGGYVSYTSNAYVILSSDILLPIDSNKQYSYGVSVKTNNTTAKSYLGFVPYDIDHLKMNSNMYTYKPNTLTTLARDLDDGDEYIYLTDMTNWNVTTAPNYQLGVIFWNYVDSTGYHYPELTYSRYSWYPLFSNNTEESPNNVQINTEIDGEVVNRIKLTSAWNHGYFPAGTKLSQCNDGSIYPYPLALSLSFGSEWANKSNVLSGVSPYLSSHTSFKNGQRYLKFLSLHNYSKDSNVEIDYKDFYLREVVE